MEDAVPGDRLSETEERRQELIGVNFCLTSAFCFYLYWNLESSLCVKLHTFIGKLPIQVELDYSSHGNVIILLNLFLHLFPECLSNADETLGEMFLEEKTPTVDDLKVSL